MRHKTFSLTCFLLLFLVFGYCLDSLMHYSHSRMRNWEQYLNRPIQNLVSVMKMGNIANTWRTENILQPQNYQRTVCTWQIGKQEFLIATCRPDTFLGWQNVNKDSLLSTVDEIRYYHNGITTHYRKDTINPFPNDIFENFKGKKLNALYPVTPFQTFSERKISPFQQKYGEIELRYNDYIQLHIVLDSPPLDNTNIKTMKEYCTFWEEVSDRRILSIDIMHIQPYVYKCIKRNHLFDMYNEDSVYNLFLYDDWYKLMAQ